MVARHILHPPLNFRPRLDFQLSELSCLTEKGSLVVILSIWPAGAKQASPWGLNSFVDTI